MNEVDAFHARAMAEGIDTYVDPETGYDVFTAAYLLRQGICCGAGCRHCPFGHENVKPAKRAVRRPSRTARGSTPKRRRRP